MKKFLALFLSFSIFFATLAFAEAPFDYLLQAEKNAAYHTEIRFTLDKPLTFLEPFLEDVGLSTSDDDLIDAAMLAESLFGAVVTADVVLRADTVKKGEISVVASFNQPVKINSHFSVASAMDFVLWASYDFDEEEPALSAIVQVPFYKKYWLIDAEDLPEEMLESIKAAFEQVEENTTLYKTLYPSCVRTQRTKSGYRITMNDVQLAKYIKGILERNAQATETNILNEMLPNIQILGRNGFSADISIKGGKIDSVKNSLQLDFRLDEIFRKIAPQEELPAYLKEAHLAFTMTKQTAYAAVGTVREVPKPAVTEENAVSIQQLFGNPYEDYYGDGEEDFYEEFLTSDYVYLFDEEPTIQDGVFMVPLEQFAASYFYYDERRYNLEAADGVVTWASDVAKMPTLRFAVGSDTYTVGDQTIVGTAALWKNGQYYVDYTVITAATGLRLVSYSHDLINDTVSMEFEDVSYYETYEEYEALA